MVSLLRYGFVFLAFVSCGALAATLTPIIEPGGRGVIGAGTGGVTITKGFPATVGASGGARLPVTITMTRGFGMPTVRAGIRGLLTRSPAGAAGSLAIGGALGAVGYLLDPANNQITKTSLLDPLPPYPPLENGMTAWVCGDGRGLTIAAAWANYTMDGPYRKGGCTVRDRNGYIDGFCEILRSSDGSYYGDYGCSLSRGNQVCPFGMSYTPSGCKTPSLIPLDNSDIDSFVDGFNDPSAIVSDIPLIIDTVPGSFDYPDTHDISGTPSATGSPTTTTSTNHTTGDVTVTDTLPSYTFDYNWDPSNDIGPSVTTTTTTTTTTHINGQPTGTTTTTDAGPNPVLAQPGGAASSTTLEIPTDCAFMPTVCEFIEWVKTPFTPEDVDFSQFTEDKDFSKSVTISGNATCPAPLFMATSKGTFEFSWQPACTFADMLKPLFLIAALIGAMYITIGIGRSD